MSAVPGKVGWPIVGDQSYSFYRDPTGFIEQNFTTHQSRIFKTRFLNKSTVFVGSNKGVQDVLHGKHMPAKSETGCLASGFFFKNA